MSDPLREPTFLTLAALAPQPLHGYAIIGEVADLSGGRRARRPGTLYGALDRLADEGLLESDREEVVDGRMRRYYRLTDAWGGPPGAGSRPVAGQRRRGAAAALRGVRGAGRCTGWPGYGSKRSNALATVSLGH